MPAWDGQERRIENLKLENEIALLGKDVQYIREKTDKIDAKLEKEYVTKNEFLPVRNIVYGLVGLILTGVIGALLVLVLGGRR